MPIFKYEVLDNLGEKKSSLFLADSQDEVIYELGKRGYFLISISSLENLPKLKKISEKKILQFTQDLYLFLKAKLTLFEAIQNIQKKEQDPNVQILSIGLLEQLKQGIIFSQALKSYNDLFDLTYIAIVAAGEESGKLENSFYSLKVILEQNLKLKKKISSQLAYPKFLCFVSFVLIIGVLTFLIPSFKDLLGDKEQKGMTRFVFGLSDSLINYFWYYLGGFALFLGSIAGVTKTLRFKVFFERISLKASPFKSFFIPSIFLRFSMIFETLLAAKVPLVDSLRLARAVLKNSYLENDIDLIIEKMKEGLKFPDAVRFTRYFPDLVQQIIYSRNETGSFDEAFHTIRFIYEEELEKNLQQLTTYIQPAMFLILGLVIGLIILSVLMPLTDVTNFQM